MRTWPFLEILALGGALLFGVVGCDRVATRIGLDPEPRDPETDVISAVVDYLRASPGAQAAGGVVLADSLGTRWSLLGTALSDSVELRARPFVTDLLLRNAVRRHVPGAVRGIAGVRLVTEASSAACAPPQTRRPRIERLSRPAFGGDGQSAYILIETVCAAPGDLHHTATLELRFRAGAWQPLRLQFVPPVPGL
jgi:hypothetical protein